MNSLPKTVTRQRRSCDLNQGPSAPESSTLTTRLSSYQPSYYQQHCRQYINYSDGEFRFLLHTALIKVKYGAVKFHLDQCRAVQYTQPQKLTATFTTFQHIIAHRDVSHMSSVWLVLFKGCRPTICESFTLLAGYQNHQGAARCISPATIRCENDTLIVNILQQLLLA